MRRPIRNFFRGLRFILEIAGTLMDVFQLILVVISIFCINTQLFSQKNLLEVKGRVSSYGDSTESIPNAEIILSVGADTVMRILSDQSGKFHDSLYLSPKQEIKITVRKTFYLDQEVVYAMQSDMQCELILNARLLELKIDRPNFPMYEFNETTHFVGFDLDLLKHQLHGFSFCYIQFSSYRNASETEAVGQNRLNSFINFLTGNGIDPQYIRVDHTPNINNCQFNDDCRGIITGVLIPTDSLQFNK